MARKTVNRRVTKSASRKPAAKVKRAPKRAPRERKRTFVFVHGAWHGGWCWVRVAKLLRARGHDVFTPTLTGVGERSHLMRAGIDIDTHIADIVNVIKWERLDDIVLVGHSYAGMVISGVAEVLPDAIRSFVVVDGFVPTNGQCVIDMTSARVRESAQAIVDQGGLGIPPVGSAFFNVNAKDRAWVDALCTPQPIGTFLQKLRLTGARDRIRRKGYIRAANYANPGFDAGMARLEATGEWKVFRVPCGHDVMVDMPGRLTEILLEMAA